MAKATPIPVGRPKVHLELEADEAEELMTYVDALRVETDPEREQRRQGLYGALFMADVRRIEDLELKLSGRREQPLREQIADELREQIANEVREQLRAEILAELEAGEEADPKTDGDARNG